MTKTFWGRHDQQPPDGTVIWRLPDGRTRLIEEDQPTERCHRLEPALKGR